MIINKKKLMDIDIAIGISILLVLYGHLYLNDSLPQWYINSREIIYKFHMPLFMFFTGFLMSYSYKRIETLTSYNTYIGKRVSKFFPAYFLFSVVFIGFEHFSNNYPLSNLKLDVIDMLVYPSKAPAGYLWYIYVLFQYYLIFPFLKKIVTKSYMLALVIGIGFQFLEFTNVFNFDLFSFYLLFIILGIIATQHLVVYYTLLKKTGWLFILTFIALVLFRNHYTISKVFFGLVSIPAVHYLALQISQFKIAHYLADIGRSSYHIYLMNTLVMGTFYILLINILKFKISLLIMLLLFFLGLFLPMVIYKKIIRPNKFLNKIIK